MSARENCKQIYTNNQIETQIVVLYLYLEYNKNWKVQK